MTLRELPSVDEVAERLRDLAAPRSLVIGETRRILASLRTQLRAGEEPQPETVEEQVRKSIDRLRAPSLRRVINATGVILHTNLGRAPSVALDPPQGYSNLEYDLASGRRGKRDSHIAPLLERLTGSPGVAVNNNAAAILLALNELAGGGEAIVSRGELIEIGDGFRIPEIMQRSGAILREVGTTNRTRIEDYRDAINDRTRLLLRVHPSNFRIEGFTARPSLHELVALGKDYDLPVFEDLGSGCVTDLRDFGIHEPLVADSIHAGVSLVSFSGDKLLGGPQAGIIAGDATLVARLRRNPVFRALRLDKLIYQALQTTLRSLLLERWHEIPALAMIMASSQDLHARADGLASKLGAAGVTVIEGDSLVGGGATPQQPLGSWLIQVKCRNVVEAERSLRRHDPAVVARIADGTLLFDLRTVFPGEEDELASAIRAAITA